MVRNPFCFRGSRESIDVIDLACGKGGDLQKWQAADVKSVTFVDVAGVSVEQVRTQHIQCLMQTRYPLIHINRLISQARERYYDMRDRQENNRWRNPDAKPLYKASFHVCSMYNNEFMHVCKVEENSKVRMV